MDGHERGDSELGDSFKEVLEWKFESSALCRRRRPCPGSSWRRRFLLSSLIFFNLVAMVLKKTSIFDLVDSDVIKTRQKFLAWYYW